MTGEEQMGQPTEITLEIKPSVVITRLEPVLGMNEDGSLRSAECGAPALRAIGGLPYMIEVEVAAFEPEYFIYEFTNINGNPGWTKFTHQAAGKVDRLGDPTWPSYIPNENGMNQEIVVFNPLTKNPTTDGSNHSNHGDWSQQRSAVHSPSVERPGRFNSSTTEPCLGRALRARPGLRASHREHRNDSGVFGNRVGVPTKRFSVTVNKSFSQSQGHQLSKLVKGVQKLPSRPVTVGTNSLGKRKFV